LVEITAIAFTQWLEQRSLLKFINEQTDFGTSTETNNEAALQPTDIEMVNSTRDPSSTDTPGEPEHVNSPLGAQGWPQANMAYGRQGKRPRWTSTHCWYALMGGFSVDKEGDGTAEFPLPNGLSRVILTTNGVRLLARDHPNIFPPIRGSEIIDKSKSNGLAKAIMCLQALWFCACVIGRLAQRLPLTVLELNTGAHCVCTLLRYLFWWNKPLDIVVPTSLKLTEKDARQKVAQMCVESSVCRFATREERVYAHAGYVSSQLHSFIN
jgi:hypothetical protein